MDTTKKERIGAVKNAGRQWPPPGPPAEVQVHDFPDPRLGQAIPSGVSDLGWDGGGVNVGVDPDPARFAVAGIRPGWSGMGEEMDPEAGPLLICADGGGSNGSRVRLWKGELQAVAAGSGLEVPVCHFPPGTRQGNQSEHRVVSHLTMTWRGRPLVSHQGVVALIAATRPATGLEVEARLDRRTDPTTVQVTKEQLERVRWERHKFHGEGNYTIRPRTAERMAKS